MTQKYTVGLQPTNNDQVIEQFLDDILKETVIKIPESTFKERFLPMFANVEKREDWDLSEWWMISGNGYSEVSIHADNNENNILFKVPPLFSRKSIYVNPATGNSIVDTVFTAAVMERDVPNTGVNHFYQYMEKSLIGEVDLSIAMQWNEIFRRYGLPEIPLNTTVVKDDKQPPSNNVEEFYED